MGISLLAENFKYAEDGVCKQSGDALHGNSQAALVIAMTSPFVSADEYKQRRRYSHEDPESTISCNTFKKANEALPWTLADYFSWVSRQEEQHWSFLEPWGQQVGQELFDAARDFIRTCALQGMSASWC